jgi:hypothetical protein
MLHAIADDGGSDRRTIPSRAAARCAATRLALHPAAGSHGRVMRRLWRGCSAAGNELGKGGRLSSR